VCFIEGDKMSRKRLMPSRRAGKANGSGTLRVHFENDTSLGPVFAVTKRRVEEALARNPKAARLVRASFGAGEKTFERCIGDADVLFAWRFPKDRIKRAAPHLKWIHVHGAGVEHLRPFDWLPEHVTLTNSRGVHGDRANEYLLMAILMLNNRIPTMVGNQMRRRWRQVYNTAITGKTLLIVGVGNLGGGAARFAKKAGLRIVGVRRTGRSHRYVDEMYTPRDLPKLLPKADFVLCAAPLTAATEHLIGRRELGLMKPTAGMINVGRAGVIDYDALADKLRRNELSGAVLDVFPHEPLPASSPLWATPNLLITPHSSSDDKELYTPKTLDLFFRNMERFAANRPLMNRVDRTLGY
jgi:phosphoglycerate dehydrogenase-like enzyme